MEKGNHIFQHWIKKNKINFPHRNQTYGYEWSISVEGNSASETPTNLSSLNVDIFQTTIDSWAELTSWGSREACYRVIRVLPRWQISLWHFRCLRMGKIDVIAYKDVINNFKYLSSRFVVLALIYVNMIILSMICNTDKKNPDTNINWCR